MYYSEELEVLDLWISDMENVIDWESAWLAEGVDAECFYSIASDPIAPE
ncbi:hypothetical protein ABMA58_20675 [Oceanospirillum sp. HFRX-1_2]